MQIKNTVASFETKELPFGQGIPWIVLATFLFVTMLFQLFKVLFKCASKTLGYKTFLSVDKGIVV